MSGSFFDFFPGQAEYRLSVGALCGADALLHCSVAVFSFRPFSQDCSVCVRSTDKKKFEAFLRGRNIPFTLVSEKGFPVFLRRAAVRPGLLLGIAAALFLLWQSANYVWDVRVYGNERLSDDDVISILADNGFSIGVRHSAIDLHALCHRIPAAGNEIAWISINMMGSVAEIQVAEYTPRPEADREDPGGMSDLVASREGQIVRFELSSGRAMVSVGQTVSKGQLLAAGWSQSETGLHPRLCSGKVFAKTTLYEEVTLPYREEIVLPRDGATPETIGIEAFFGGKRIFFLKKGRHIEEKYDTITDEYRPTVCGVALPVVVRRTAAIRTGTVERIRTPEEIKKEAQETLLHRLTAAGAQVLSYTFLYEEGDRGLRTVCQAQCIVDIAQPQKILAPYEDGGDPKNK